MKVFFSYYCVDSVTVNVDDAAETQYTAPVNKLVVSISRVPPLAFRRIPFEVVAVDPRPRYTTLVPSLTNARYNLDDDVATMILLVGPQVKLVFEGI